MLYIVATPIGNLEDITQRALRILGEVDFILAEDTRKTGLLLKHLCLKKKLISFYEYNETKKIPWVIEELKKGRNLALVSNAGTPTISDPGYRLIRECQLKNLTITSLPGPSSITCALTLTSLPHDKFAFLGYLPRKKNARRKLLEKLKSWQISCVFFESPFRVITSLKDIIEILPTRRIAVFRELTKKFEEVWEGNLEEALKHFKKNKPRGEFTLIIGRNA